jgi:hypothetical protein
VEEISALVSDVGVGALEQQYCFTSPIATFLTTGYSSLRSSQSSLSFFVVAGIFDGLVITEYSKVGQSYIDSRLSGTDWKCSWCAFDEKASKPSVSLAFDGDFLDSAMTGAVVFQLYMTCSLNVQFTIWHEPTTIPVSERQTIVSPVGLVSWIARFLSTFIATEESAESSIEPTQYIPATGVVYKTQTPVGSHSCQLFALAVVADGLSTDLPSLGTLLKSSIVKRTGFPQLSVQELSLSLGRIDPVSIGPNHPKRLSQIIL